MHTDEAYFTKIHAKSCAEAVLRERLLTATLDCVAERGFAATSTDNIAQRANLSSGTLFRFYANKSILLRAALDQACRVLRGADDIELEGNRLRDQLWNLWNRASQNALASPTAFHYWRLYRATPMDIEWGFPAEMRLGPFSGIPLMMSQAGRPDHSTELDGWLAAAQWTAAVQFVLAPARAPKYVSPRPTVAPTIAQVSKYSFDAYWAGLGLETNRPRVHYAYIH
jgi:AcrR family transcriptional regulator